MKLKFLLASIFVLICFVAYQKYSDYSTLKSIDSYDSCATAKGSIIQESYPATCITLLGNRFSQWTKYENLIGKYTFDYPSNWEYIPDKREIWNDIIVGDGDNKDSLKSFIQVSIINSLNFYVPWSSKKEIKLNKNNLGQYILLGDTPANTEIDHMPAAIKKTINDSGMTTNIAILDNSRIVSIQIFTATELQNLHDQIISSFKFTDKPEI